MTQPDYPIKHDEQGRVIPGPGAILPDLLRAKEIQADLRRRRFEEDLAETDRILNARLRQHLGC
jgi:hypothetical protein